MTTRAARDAPSQLGSLWHLATLSSLRMLNAHTPASNFKSKSQADYSDMYTIILMKDFIGKLYPS